MRLRSLAALAAVALVPACNGDGLGTSGDGGGADLAPAADLATAPDLRPEHSGVGDPCTSSGFFQQGDCADGQICIQDGMFGFTDGYCTQTCGGGRSCPSDANCVPIPGTGMSSCFIGCTDDQDCRQPDYLCSSMSHTCVPRNMGGGQGGEVMPGTNNGAACVTPVVSPPTAGGVFGANAQLSSGDIEAETQLAVDPVNHRIVAAWIDTGFNNGIGVVRSGDGGASWGGAIGLPIDQTIDKTNSQSDPVVAVDSRGNFYVAWVGFDQGRSQPSNMQMFVARSTDGGVTFPDLFIASPIGEWSASFSLDKPWIAVNPVDDSVYVSWSRASVMSGQTAIRMVRSTDQGQTWSAPVAVNDSGQRINYDRNLAQIAVGADGNPVVAWVELLADAMGSTDNAVYIQRFGADLTKNQANVKVTRGDDSPTFDDPSVAVSGSNIYVGFVSGDSTGAWDVRVSASINGGAGFMASVKVNDDPTCATHFHHQIAADGSGNVHAIWIDNRYLVGNVFYASSPAAAAGVPLQFGANQFVSDQSFEFTTSRTTSNWLGDYIGLTTAGKEIYAVWTDPRGRNRSHIYFARGTVP